ILAVANDRKTGFACGVRGAESGGNVTSADMPSPVVVRIKQAASWVWIPIAGLLVLVGAVAAWLLRKKPQTSSGLGPVAHVIQETRERIAIANHEAAIEIQAAREGDQAVLIELAAIAVVPDTAARLARLVELRKSLEPNR